MNKKTWVIITVISLVVIASALYFLKFRRSGVSQIKSAKDFNFIVVTVDTLRADRLGCYGFRGIKTPTIDFFAEQGIRFEKCISQTPLTLPSHTSLMTGTYPTFHGVRDNGGFLVPPELTTLAETFKQKDYQTAAFVASYVLDSKWGLNQGFDHYFDRFDLSRYQTISLGMVQRRGDEVINEALNWLDEHKQEKFFTWIHLYDPHTPYEPPSPYLEQYPNRPYLGEIAYTDSLLGQLWAYLEKNKLTENTIFVFASDHGESLGEHQESTHGFFIYQEGVHVPLIIVTPFEKFKGLTRHPVVNLVDIMPTLLEMADIPVPSQVQGKSLIPILLDDQTAEGRYAYSETFYPRYHYGWSELTSFQDGRYKLIIAPRLELYDLSRDPDESINLIDAEAAKAREMKSLADRFIEETGKNSIQLDYRSMDEDARQKLAALGYIGSFTDTSSLSGKSLGDPKDKITIFNRLSQAREMGLAGDFDEAISMVEKIIAEDPAVIDAYFTKGNIQFKQRDFQGALESFLQALERKPDDVFTVINVANSYMGMGDLEEAEKFMDSIKDALAPDSQIYLLLGNINNLLKDYDEAEKYYKECMRLNPSSATAYNALGAVYISQERLDEAEVLLQEARNRNPEMANLHYNFAQLHEARGDLRKAEEEYLAELEYIPHNFRASFNLSRVYRLMGHPDKEEMYLNKAIELNPHFPLSYFYLARIYLNRGDEIDEAIDLVNKGIELKPEEKDLPLGYFLLADLYNRTGQFAKSSEFAAKGQNLVRSSKDK